MFTHTGTMIIEIFDVVPVRTFVHIARCHTDIYDLHIPVLAENSRNYIGMMILYIHEIMALVSS